MMYNTRLVTIFLIALALNISLSVSGLDQSPIGDSPSTSSPKEATTTELQAGRFVHMNEQQKYQIVTESTYYEERVTTATSPATIQMGSCKLGNESYPIGDKWNPDLPPHGIQFCVLCECIGYLKGAQSEAKLTCRRIAKDCPRLDSCPFGEKPIVPPGQCCKSCLSHNILGEGPIKPTPDTSTPSNLHFDDGQQQNVGRTANFSAEQGKPILVNVTSTVNNHQRANKTKAGGLRPNNKQLNTKDSKMAFKSLESQSRSGSSAEPSKGDPPDGDLANGPPPSACKLGNNTYTIGDSWSPNLPPFGIQVCVLCECVARLRKACYEAKVTCRRIANECPIIESCPDGGQPMTAPGECCKSCPLASSTTEVSATIEKMVQKVNSSEATSPIGSLDNRSPPDLVQPAAEAGGGVTAELRGEHTKVTFRPSFQIKDLPLCKRDGSDSSVGNISKRSQGSTNYKKKPRKGTKRNKINSNWRKDDSLIAAN